MKTFAYGTLALAGLTALSAGAAVRFRDDLSKMAENRAEIRRTIDDQKASPADRLLARYDDLKWELLTCEEKDFPSACAAMTKLLTERGDADKAAYLRLVVTAVRDDLGAFRVPADRLWALADEVSRGDAGLRKEYYYWRLLTMKRAQAWNGTVDPAMSAEARLRLVEQKAKDPAFKPPADCDGDRVDCLTDMGRFEEAEKLLVKRASADDGKGRRLWLPRLAAFYRDRAARYCSDPDAATLRKVVEVCDRMLADDAAGGKPSEYSRKACLLKGQVLFDLGDFAAARQAADDAVRFAKDGVCDFEGAKLYASVAFAARRWDEVVARLSPFADKLDADLNVRCAQALVAAGRRKDSLVYLERAAKKCRNKYKRTEYEYLCRKYSKEP